MIELEKRYLAKFIPKDIKNFESKEIIDIYIPESSKHPVLRIRKNGENYEITKKQPGEDRDNSSMEEQTISLTEEEFNSLANLNGKVVHKVRYYYDHGGRFAEIGVFQSKLNGLVIVDFEFENSGERENFKMPDFCLADVTSEEFLAGGMLCGKSLGDIEQNLKKFGYKKLFLD